MATLKLAMGSNFQKSAGKFHLTKNEINQITVYSDVCKCFKMLLSLNFSTYPSGLSMTAAASCEKLSGRKKGTDGERPDGRTRARTDEG